MHGAALHQLLLLLPLAVVLRLVVVCRDAAAAHKLLQLPHGVCCCRA